MLPLVFLLFLGIYWFGRAYNIYATITHAAREGARAATAPTAALLGNTPLTAAQVATRVSEVFKLPSSIRTSHSPPAEPGAEGLPDRYAGSSRLRNQPSNLFRAECPAQ